MKVKIFLVFFITSVYWSCTLFFTVPENYLQIKSMQYQQLFSTFFYQQWSFFAPPPQYNDRLYYEFVNTKNDTIVVEVMEPIQNKRQENFLTNDDESIIDYLLLNSVSNVTDAIRENYNAYSYDSCRGTPEQECFEIFLKEFEKEMYSMSELKTLSNYGKIIRKKNNLSPAFSKFKIIHTNIPVRKFSDRGKKDLVPEEQFMMQTKYYDLNTKTWIY